MSKIKCYVGPMKSGKSKKLLTDLEDIRDIYSDEHILIIKPNLDSRTPGVIKSRDGRSAIAHEVENFNDINKFINNLDIKYIFIDEIQFINSIGMLDFYKLVRKKNINVIASGLNLTSEIKTFAITAKFMCFSDEIEVINGVCEKCLCKSTLSDYISKDDKNGSIKIGDSEYISVCHNHHSKM